MLYLSTPLDSLGSNGLPNPTAPFPCREGGRGVRSTWANAIDTIQFLIPQIMKRTSILIPAHKLTTSSHLNLHRRRLV